MSGFEPGQACFERTSGQRAPFPSAVAEAADETALRAALAGSLIFSHLPEAERDWLFETGRIERLAAGETVFSSGDPATHVYCVLAGCVVIETCEPGVELNRLGAGEMFGEIGVIEDCSRTASVRAAEPCALLAIEPADFLGLLVSHPAIGVRLVASLARRLEHLTELVGSGCAARRTARAA